MAKVGLQRAAELTGRSRSTIHRAMAAGRLSFARSETGERLIDVAELERVFGLSVPDEKDGNVAPEPPQTDPQLVELRAKLEIELARVGMLTERLEELREERDRWRQQAERLLTDQRPAAPAMAPETPRGWLRRLFG